MADKSIADRLFDAQLEIMCAEGAVDDLIGVAIGDLLEDAWSEYTFDYYDRSVEIYGVTMPPPAGWQEKFREAGFYYVWLHDHARDVDNCSCPPVVMRPDIARAEIHDGNCAQDRKTSP